MARAIADFDLGWAVGLFEGEGSVFVGGRNQPRVSLVMTDEDSVRRFAEIVGCGNVRHYARPGKFKSVWQWSVQGADDVLAVLGLFWPHLGERRKLAATLVIERASEMNQQRGFCRRGHDLADPSHLYIHKKTGKRHCRTCRREYARGWRPRLAR